MGMNDIDIKNKCQGEEFAEWAISEGLNDLTVSVNTDKKPKQARHQY